MFVGEVLDSRTRLRMVQPQGFNALLLFSISTGARCRLDRSLRDPSPALPNASLHGMGGLGLAAARKAPASLTVAPA